MEGLNHKEYQVTNHHNKVDTSYLSINNVDLSDDDNLDNKHQKDNTNNNSEFKIDGKTPREHVAKEKAALQRFMKKNQNWTFLYKFNNLLKEADKILSDFEKYVSRSSLS